MSAVLLAPVLVLAACGGDDPTGPDTSANATVQFINASTTSLEFAANDTLATGGGPLSYGSASRCVSVNAANSGLAVRTPGNNAIAGFTPAFTAGGSYSVIAYPGTTTVAQFVTVSNRFTPASGQAGLHVINLGPVGSNYDVYFGTTSALGTAVATSLGVGVVSNFFNVSTTSGQSVILANAGTKTLVAAFGTNFSAGKNYTLVITPTSTNSPTGFFNTGC